jgi:hypothetical protein
MGAALLIAGHVAAESPCAGGMPTRPPCWVVFPTRVVQTRRVSETLRVSVGSIPYLSSLGGLAVSAALLCVGRLSTSTGQIPSGRFANRTYGMRRREALLPCQIRLIRAIRGWFFPTPNTRQEGAVLPSLTFVSANAPYSTPKIVSQCHSDRGPRGYSASCTGSPHPNTYATGSGHLSQPGA